VTKKAETDRTDRNDGKVRFRPVDKGGGEAVLDEKRRKEEKEEENSAQSLPNPRVIFIESDETVSS